MKGTRRDILLQLEKWSKDDDQDKRVFWLNGLVGTGKSTIAQTFAEMCFADGKLGASFFCSRDFDDRSNLRSIFPTLAFQLAHRYPQFRKKLLPVLMANPDVGREVLCSQMEKIIVGPFQAARALTLVVIDALDECRDEEPASALLSVLSRYVDDIPLVKFFITGRPEPRIHSGFRLESLRPHTDILKLHEVEPSSVDSDIKLIESTEMARWGILNGETKSFNTRSPFDFGNGERTSPQRTIRVLFCDGQVRNDETSRRVEPLVTRFEWRLLPRPRNGTLITMDRGFEYINFRSERTRP